MSHPLHCSYVVIVETGSHTCICACPDLCPGSSLWTGGVLAGVQPKYYNEICLLLFLSQYFISKGRVEVCGVGQGRSMEIFEVCLSTIGFKVHGFGVYHKSALAPMSSLSSLAFKTSDIFRAIKHIPAQ